MDLRGLDEALEHVIPGKFFCTSGVLYELDTRKAREILGGAQQRENFVTINFRSVQ